MQVFSEERAYLIAAADELEDYLLSGAANWRLAGPESFPPLTPGYVLLTMKRLAGLRTVDSEYGQIQEALDKIEEIRLRWKSVWIKRSRQEIPQRLRLWSNYLDGLLQTSNLAHQEFSWSVRWRVMLVLLAEVIGDQDPETSQRLIVMDERLRAISLPGSFVWDKRLESIFNPVDFWFLYLQISLRS